MYIYLNVCKQMTDVELLQLHRNTWNHLTAGKQMSSGSFWHHWINLIYQPPPLEQDMTQG